MKHQPLLRLGRLAVLGVLCLASCQVAKEVNVADRVSYDLTVVASLPETRTTNEGTHTYWAGGDMLSVLHSAAGETQFYGSTFTYSGEENRFTGRAYDVSTVNDWYFLYPYREDNVDAKQMHINVANVTVQTGNDNMAHIAGEGIPLWGRALNVERSTSLNVTMQNVLAIHEFPVFNDTEEPIIVKEITLAVPVPATGSYVGDLTANNVEWVPDGAASQNVSVQVADGEAIAVGKTGSFYAATVPLTLAAGSKMNVHVVAVHPSNPAKEIDFYYVKTLNSTNTMSAGSIKTFPISFDENHQTPDPDAPAVKKDQTLSFDNETWTWTLGDRYALNGIYDLPMTVNGAQTSPVTYSSDDTSVAEITSEGKVLIKGIGYTYIKAIAPENEEYNSNEASFKLIIAEAAVTPSTGTSYVKASSLTVGGTYLVVDVSDTRLFKGNADGTYVSVSPANGVITDADNAFAGYEFTVTQSGSKYCIVFNDGKYLACDYQQSTGNNTTGIRYESNQPESRYLYDLTVTNGVFFFSTDQMNSTSTDQYLYYKPQADGGTGPDKFKIGGSGNKYGVHLYLKTAVASKQSQTLSFGDVTWTLGDTYQLNGTYNFPAAKDAMTTVTYESDNNSVVEIVGGTNRVKINGTGTAQITATAVETATYYGTSATMTFTIKPASTTPVTGSAYVKVTGEPTSWDGTYLFVDETSSKAFAAISGVSGYAVNVTISNGRIAANSTVNQYALTVTDAGRQHGNSNVSNQEAYNVRNSEGKYIYVSQSTIRIEDTNVGGSGNYTYYHAFKYFGQTSTQAAGVQVLSANNTGNTVYYMGYSSNAFSYSTSNSGSRVQLYKLEGEGGGTDPVDPGTDPEPGTNTTYTKLTSLSSIVAGGTYLITDVSDTRLFKGATDGSYETVSPVNGVITDATNSLAGYEFKLMSTGSNKYNLVFNNQYLICDYSNSGNSTTGLVYLSQKPEDTYAYSVSLNSKGAFEFMTAQRNSTSTSEVLYYKTQDMTGDGQNRFKIGGSGAGVGVHLYLKTTSGGGTTPSKQNQTFSFSQPTVNWTLGNGHSAGTSYAMQGINGQTYGALTYSSSDPSVATISNGQITIRKAGSTTISVTAAGNDTYNSHTASYLLVISENTTPTTGTAYVKTSSLTVGGTYLITDVSDTRLFKGNADGTYISVSPANGVITDASNSLAAYEFTVTQASNGKYNLVFNDGKYLICDYSNNGNSTTGLTYLSSQPDASYTYSFTVNNNGAIEFMTAQRNSSSTSEVLYYKTQNMEGNGQDRFKIGGSGAGVGVHIYLKESSGSGKQAQNLTFSSSTQTYAYEQNDLPKTVTRQTVQNSHGTVTYRSDNPNVATVSGTTVTLVGFGEAKIYADATGDDDWYAASQYYTINVVRTSAAGVFNLENNEKSNNSYTQGNVRLFFDAAYANYTSSNRSTSYASQYGNRGSSSTRYDWPSPATVTWTSTATSNLALSVYYDANHTNEEIMAVPKIGTNTADIYNLIPNRTYYWVLKSGSQTIASGQFSTEGRRRMVGIGEKTNYGQNYANNCRDLGGQQTTDGRTIKYGKIYRGTNMDNTTTTQKDYIVDKMKIGLDVDLRTIAENHQSNNGNNQFNALESKGFVNIDNGIYNIYQGHTQEEYSGGEDLTNKNKMKATLMRIFNAVDNGVNVYIHCMVGADRTGGTCLYLESLLGVPPEKCDIDFELTSFSTVGTRSRTGGSSQYSAVYNAINGVSNANASTWQEKAIYYCVNTLGIDRAEITKFQSNMLE